MLLNELGQLALTFDEFVEVGVRLSEFVAYLFVFLKHVYNFLSAFLHHLTYGFAVVELRFLVEHADGVAWREHHFAVVRLLLACDDAQQCRFSGAVQADDAYFRSIVKREVYIFQNLS